MEKEVKTIKLFDGVKVTTDDEIKKYPGMTVFDEVIQCDEKTRRDIITALITQRTVDLSSVTEKGERLILDLYFDGKPEASADDV